MSDWVDFTKPGFDGWVSKPVYWLVRRLCWWSNVAPVTWARVLAVVGIAMMASVAFVANNIIDEVSWMVVALFMVWIVLIDAAPKWEKLSASLWDGQMPIEFPRHVLYCSRQRRMLVGAIAAGVVLTATGTWGGPVLVPCLVVGSWVSMLVVWYCLTASHRGRPRARTRVPARVALAGVTR